jgi:hypothetical protein
MFGDPAIGGRFFYNEELTGHNFQRRPQRIVASLDRMLALLEEANPEAIYVGAVPTPASMPGFTRDNTMPLVDATAVPRVWICNRVTVQTHYDISNNIACVAAGRRRFTVFPPEQLVNLYVGPLEFTLAGQPISMVRLDQPDFERFPRFRDALATAQFAGWTATLFVLHGGITSSRAARRAGEPLVGRDAVVAGSPFEALLHGDHGRETCAGQARNLAQGVRALRVQESGDRWRISRSASAASGRPRSSSPRSSARS